MRADALAVAECGGCGEIQKFAGASTPSAVQRAGAWLRGHMVRHARESSIAVQVEDQAAGGDA